MTKPYAQPVYRAAGGAICDTEEEARERSREHYIRKRVSDYVNSKWKLEQYPDSMVVTCRAEDKLPRLSGEAWDILDWLWANAEWVMAIHKQACEYADARLAEADNGEEE